MSGESGFIVGKCKACSKPIDNAVEGYITDDEGHLYHVSCYGQPKSPKSRSPRVTGSKPGRTG